MNNSIIVRESEANRELPNYSLIPVRRVYHTDFLSHEGRDNYNGFPSLEGRGKRGG